MTADDAAPVDSAPFLDNQPSVMPEELVESYYRWYLSSPGEYGARKALKKRRLLSPAFIGKLQQAPHSSVEQVDLLFCSDRLPASISVQETLIEGNQAQVLLLTDRGDLLRVLLQSHQSAWQIVDVICQDDERIRKSAK